MTTTNTTPLRYVGGMPAVTVVLRSGRTVTVERGDTFDALPAEVDALSGRPDFEVASPSDESTPKE